MSNRTDAYRGTMTLVGFEPHEINTAESTRSARLKWVVIVDSSLPAGRQVNAAVCVAAATTASVRGLLGPDALDADRVAHPGLPWAGCTVLGATPQRLASVRAAASEVFVADMPALAQETRVYDEYLEQLAATPTAELRPLAISLIGPRAEIDRLVKRLSLLP